MDANSDQNSYGVNIENWRRMRSWSTNESPKNQNIGKQTSEKVVQTCSSKKLKEPHVPEPRQIDLKYEMRAMQQSVDEKMGGFNDELRDECNNYGEKLNNIMMDIRLWQDQIISKQIDLKYEMRAMQRSVDEKISGFVEGKNFWEDECNNYGEKLNNIMMYIRLWQDQIISKQIDLKYEMRAMQRSVDEKISGFVEGKNFWEVIF
ncbi:hypothetical protein Fot_42277 [Forsythia ovata]|uniref:Uncharacterized protein n=1 Tax=Forsythia ovata TaxID=205694 RepID=A0ABD1RKP9_9LAMI